jgi:hypothetical protein
VGVGVALGVGIGVGVALGVGVGVGTFTGAALMTTPLFHTNFFPCLTQVYLRPLSIVVSPAFLHAEPALTAALEGRVITRDSAIAALTAKARRFISIPFALPNRTQSWPTPPTFVTGDQSVFHTAKPALKANKKEALSD